MAAVSRAYVVAAGLALAGALATGGGMDAGGQGGYRDRGGPRALWDIPDGRALPPSAPVRVEIPAAGVDAAVTRTGLNGDGTVEVPPLRRAGRVGWYGHGPAPGSRGPAVLLGHYDDRDGPAVFHRLHRLRPGAQVRVRRRDGRTAVFRVDATERVPKRRFPRTRVYGEVRYAGLRLVTCGGEYDADDRSYRDNLIVYAHLEAAEGGRPAAQARP